MVPRTKVPSTDRAPGTRHSSISPNDDHSQAGFVFPKSYQLIITTAKGVYTWSSHGITEIFRSGSAGIVAARKVTNGSGLLAVADSQVVLLHDINKGMQRSYRLKGSDGQIRLLIYGSGSDSLFFTTSLQNAIQSYSLKQAKLLDPSHTHPSPPTVFALSPTSRLLLSASSRPPTILLTNIVLGNPPILLSPGCSSSAVVAAAFHPERSNIFLLAFNDGTAAAYNAKRLYKYGSNDCKTSSVRSGHVSEIAHIKNLHTVGTKVTTENGITIQDRKPGMENVSVGDEAAGITAIAFVPGFKYVAFSVGFDGKCCLVDFGAQVRGAARKLGSWYTGGSATSLAMISVKEDDLLGDFGGSRNLKDRKSVSQGILVAIGLQAGKVLLFDLSGNLRGQQTLDPDGADIIDVEWQNEAYSELLEQRTNGSTLPQDARIRSTRKSLGSILAGGRPVAEEVLALIDESKDNLILKDKFSPLKERQVKSSAREVVPVASALNHIDLMSPLKPQRTAPVIGRRGSSRKQTSSASSVRTVKRKKPPEGSQHPAYLSCDPGDYTVITGNAVIETSVGHPSEILPPQQSLRRGGPLAWHRPQPSRNIPNPTDTDVVPIVSVKDFPLPPADSKGGVILARGSTCKPRDKKPEEQSSSADTLEPESPGDAWTDIEAQSRRTPRRSSHKATNSRKPSRLSRIVAPIDPSPPDPLVSEASTNIAIDRAPASLRPSAFNTMPRVAHAPKELPVIPEQYYPGPSTASSHSSASRPSNDSVIDWPPPLRTRRDSETHDDPAGPAPPNTTSATQSNPATPTEAPSKPQPLRVITHSSRSAARPSSSRSIEQTAPLPPPSRRPPRPTAKVSGRLTSNPCPCCTLHTQFQLSLQDSLGDFTEDTRKQFAAQKEWFENAMREADEWRARLEEENRRLRGELARERRGWRVV